tara:strand:- start:23101 stop:24483 length:1383 start_codon:yes stop_codon:yes gene_type:complete
MNLQNVTVNFSSSVRHDTMEGREYLVAPMVMLTEGVHKGSNGSLYYPRDELSKTPEVWNHKPVVVYHPTMNGVGVSACDPDIITSRKVGVIMNTRFDAETGKLRAEAWLEKDRIQKVDPRIAGSLERSEIMELSTGLFTDNENMDGDFDGKSYSSVARNYRPDHLALLPDKKGACSIEDGAGLLQLNSSEKGTLEEAICLEFGEGVVPKDIVTKQVIFSKEDQLFRVDFTTNESGFVFDQKSLVEVSRELSYQAITETQSQGENEMAKSIITEKVNGLISNENTQFNEEDQEGLSLLSEATLDKLEPVLNDEDTEDDSSEETEAASEEVAEVKCEDDGEETCDAEKETEAVENQRPLSAKEYVANAPPEIRDLLESGLASHQRDRDALIDVIVANENNIFEKQQLAEKSMSELKGLAALAAKAESVPSYAGAATPAPVGNKSQEEQPLLIPVMNWDGSEV